MYDVVIVGAGPAGLSAALTLGRSCRTVILADSGPGRAGGVGHVHGLLARDGLSIADLRSSALRDLKRYPSVEVRESAVDAVTPEPNSFHVSLAGGTSVRARRVLLATGVVDELPPINGLRALWGTRVLHCLYCHGWEVRDTPLGVLARHPQDVHLAVRLSALSREVTLFSDGTYGLDESQSALLDAAGVAVEHAKIVSVSESMSGTRAAVTLRPGDRVELGALFVRPRLMVRGDLARRLGCEFTPGGAAVTVDGLQRTSVPGVWAAGDLTRRSVAVLRGTQVTSAAAEGHTAAVAIDQELAFASYPPHLVRGVVPW